MPGRGDDCGPLDFETVAADFAFSRRVQGPFRCLAKMQGGAVEEPIVGGATRKSPTRRFQNFPLPGGMSG